MTQEMSFENLPQAVAMLTSEVRSLRKLLTEKQEQPLQVESKEKFLIIDEAAEFLNLTKPTIYTKVSKRELPFMKRGNRLYFSTVELSEYLRQGSHKTNADLEAEADSYLSKKKGLSK